MVAPASNPNETVSQPTIASHAKPRTIGQTPSGAPQHKLPIGKRIGLALLSLLAFALRHPIWSLIVVAMLVGPLFRRSPTTTAQPTAPLLRASQEVASDSARKASVPDACGWLADTLSTRGWTDHEDGEWGCFSPYLSLAGEGAGIPNNLAYYVVGTWSTAKRAYLVLNVNQRGSEAAAKDAFASAASALLRRATNQDLSPNMRKSISTGMPKRWNVGATAVELRKNTYSSGKVYELRFEVSLAPSP